MLCSSSIGLVTPVLTMISSHYRSRSSSTIQRVTWADSKDSSPHCGKRLSPLLALSTSEPALVKLNSREKLSKKRSDMYTGVLPSSLSELPSASESSSLPTTRLWSEYLVLVTRALEPLRRL